MGEDLPGGAGGGPIVSAAGSRIAGYLLEEELGAGGMAVVFRARDERLDRPVALKLLAPGLAADEEFRRRFLRESRAAAAVDDPHIIPVYEAGQAGGVLFIAMRYVSGGDVRGLLRRLGTLPPGRAAAIISPVASALDAAHGAGLVHRDVKPGNMLIDARPGRPDHVYLSDFGLSKARAASALTGTGLFLGTAAYVAPEQIQGGEVDGRADQYALGCVAFELLGGTVPFERDQDMAVIYAHLSVPPPLLSARRPGLPAVVDGVLGRALAKAPDDRYASCGEFAAALRQALGLPGYDRDPGAVAARAAVAPGQAPAAPTAADAGATVISPTRAEVEAAARAGMAPGGAGMRALPTGMITMLFSGIEGSTALLTRLGDQYSEALSAERAMLRAAVSACRGHEMGSEGDSFFAVFGSAGEAVRCCVQAQRSLAGRDWPGGVAVRVQMGMHTGTPARHEDGYIGLDVHRAARIAAAAHGGQVVLSDATWQRVQPGLPAGVSVRDLGFHRLKDIEAPERIYQLVAPGLAGAFPPLKSLGAPTSLPVPLTPLVGRDDDLEQVRAAVGQGGIRLVTLTGPGGVGKTRLALAAAACLEAAFRHGVFFVPLAAVRDAGIMWKAIADSLGAGGDGDAEAVADYLSARQALMVLDNLEQLEGAARVVAALLASSPGLVILATSRRPLHLRGEQELPVPPLEIPRAADVKTVAGAAAPRLFVQQARMVRPDFALTADNAADIAAICRRLDGLPLALELAAPRVKLLAPRALLARLGTSLDLAAADAGQPSRQQTLRNTIAWSYDLLTSESAGVLRRAGVFAGGCDLDALAAVAMAGGQAAGTDPLELAAELQDVSLVTVTEGADGEPRLGLLETIREYALERLAQAGELDDTRRRHAEYYTAFAERAREHVGGPAHLTALDRLEAEHDNLRVALSWSLESDAPGRAGNGERAVIGLRLVQALTTLWYHHGHAAEGRRWLERAIAVTAGDAAAPLARLKHGLGVTLQQQGELDASVQALEQSLAIWRELGDREEQARELNSLGGTHRHLGHLDTARTLFEESAQISREIGSDARLATALTNLGEVEISAGNLDRASQALREALELDGKQGDVSGVALDQQALAMVSLRAGRAEEARDLLSASLDYVVSSGDTELLANSLELSACITADLGGHLRAARIAGAAEAIRQKAGMPIPQEDAALLERFLAPARAAVPRRDWETELDAGRSLTHQQAVKLLTLPAR